MIEISGFADEISGSLNRQIRALNALNQRFICLRRLDGKNIAEYTAEEFVRKAKPRLDEAGIKISSIGSPIGKIGLYDDEAYGRQLRQLSELVRICSATGCGYIRTFSFFMSGDPDFGKALPEVVRRVKGFLDVVRGTGIVLLHENEKKIYGSVPDRVLKLFEAVDDPQYRLCYDASNYLQCGADPYAAYEATREHTVYYHMKDCLNGIEVPLGTGEGRIRDIVSDLVRRGYDGFLTLEPHTAKYALLRKPLRALPPAGRLKALRETFAKIDADRGKRAFERVTRRDVYEWQLENLKKILKEAGYAG